MTTFEDQSIAQSRGWSFWSADRDRYESAVNRLAIPDSDPLAEHKDALREWDLQFLAETGHMIVDYGTAVPLDRIHVAPDPRQ